MAVLASTLVLATCGRDRSAASAVEQDTAATAGPVVLLLDVPPRARIGVEVAIAATLVNRGDASESVPAAGPDIVITRADGTEVWRRSRHAPRASATPAAALKPREMRGSGYTWDQRDDAGRQVPPGTYHVRATIPSGPGVAASAVRTLVLAL
ncbi:MAG TPA: hypothetical protein VF541_10910 [Longimicrobium sp.]